MVRLLHFLRYGATRVELHYKNKRASFTGDYSVCILNLFNYTQLYIENAILSYWRMCTVQFIWRTEHVNTRQQQKQLFSVTICIHGVTE